MPETGDKAMVPGEASSTASGGASSTHNAELPSWVALDRRLRWWSESQQKYMAVRVSKIDDRKKLVIVTFELDKSVWKSVPFSKIGRSGCPLKELESSGSASSLRLSGRKDSYNQGSSKSSGQGGTSTPDWWTQEKARLLNPQEAKEKEAELERKRKKEREELEQKLEEQRRLELLAAEKKKVEEAFERRKKEAEEQRLKEEEEWRNNLRKRREQEAAEEEAHEREREERRKKRREDKEKEKDKKKREDNGESKINQVQEQFQMNPVAEKAGIRILIGEQVHAGMPTAVPSPPATHPLMWTGASQIPRAITPPPAPATSWAPVAQGSLARPAANPTMNSVAPVGMNSWGFGATAPSHAVVSGNWGLMGVGAAGGNAPPVSFNPDSTAVANASTQAAMGLWAPNSFEQPQSSFTGSGAWCGGMEGPASTALATPHANMTNMSHMCGGLPHQYQQASAASSGAWTGGWMGQ